jgi:myosin heavy subunit
MRDIKSLLLLLLSAGLISTWIYHLYDKTQYSQRRTEVYIKDSIAVAEGIRDSLYKIYSATITDLDTRLDSTASSSDSLQSELTVKAEQIRNLQREINGILGKKGATREELTTARRKINELPQIVEDLRSKNRTMEDEQKRLNSVMAQLNGDIQGLQQNMRRLDDENKQLTEKINLASVFVASELKLSPVTVRGSREEETSQARKVEKLVLSFLVQNNINQYNNAEVFVVVTGPDGEVLQNPVWESRTMDTKNEGKKEYTLKVRFDYEKGEQKRHIFSIDADKYQKGNYTMKVYHNGYMIGQTVKTLS